MIPLQDKERYMHFKDDAMKNAQELPMGELPLYYLSRFILYVYTLDSIDYMNTLQDEIKGTLEKLNSLDGIPRDIISAVHSHSKSMDALISSAKGITSLAEEVILPPEEQALNLEIAKIDATVVPELFKFYALYMQSKEQSSATPKEDHENE